MQALATVPRRAPPLALSRRDRAILSVAQELVGRTTDFGEIWNAIHPKLDLRERLPSFEATVGQWYVSYANMDVMECIEWQLAERSDDLSTNPFVPLLRVYAEGFYPFSLAPNEVVLFAFSA